MTNMQENNIKPGYKKTPIGIIPEDWSIMKLKEIGKFFKGKGISKRDLVDDGINAIRYGEIYTDHHFFIKEFYSFINQNTADESFKLNQGDILFTGSGETREEIGKSVAFIGNEEVYASGDIIILRPEDDKYDSKFLGFITNHDVFKRQTYKVGQGNSVVHIYSSNLEKTELPIPSLPEQKSIAACLSTWDKGIEKLTALIEAKKQQKKGLMRQLFNGQMKIENGQLKRVENEEDWLKGWKEVRLGDIAKFLKGNGLSKDAIEDNGKSNCILYGELYTTYSEVIKLVKSKTNSDEGTQSKIFDILIPGSTTTNGLDLITASCLLENNVLLGGDVIIMRPDVNKLDARFFAYFFTNGMKQLVLKYTQGVTIIHLYGKDLKEVKVKLPPFEEQTVIAEVLSTADKEIELLEKKLEAMKMQKKGLMQVLLTGEKRLINN